MVRNTAAAEGCEDFGWIPQGRVDTNLVTEIAQHPRLGMGHAWSRSGDYVLTTAPERIHLVLTLAVVQPSFATLPSASTTVRPST